MITEHPAHAGLGWSERGDRMMGGVGHWHMKGTNQRQWVKGSVEDCNTAYADEQTLAQIRGADEAIDPMPENLGQPILGVEDHRDVSVKPQRGGKRTCAHTWPDDAGIAGCGHSESRHNASGKCRTCPCDDFRVRSAG